MAIWLPESHQPQLRRSWHSFSHCRTTVSRRYGRHYPQVRLLHLSFDYVFRFETLFSTRVTPSEGRCNEPATFTGSIPPDGATGNKAVAWQMLARPSRHISDQGVLSKGPKGPKKCNHIAVYYAHKGAWIEDTAGRPTITRLHLDWPSGLSDLPCGLIPPPRPS